MVYRSFAIMTKYPSDQKNIQLSMILLFLALLVIYILLFSIKGDKFKQELPTNTNNNTTQNYVNTTTPNKT
ncbi:MAG: hypothetical protein GXP45_00025 [bacterium]|nr:hypothetical protein [bacterium]